MVLIAFVHHIEASVLNREYFIASLKFLVVHLNTALDYMYLVVFHHCQHMDRVTLSPPAGLCHKDLLSC